MPIDEVATRRNSIMQEALQVHRRSLHGEEAADEGVEKGAAGEGHHNKQRSSLAEILSDVAASGEEDEEDGCSTTTGQSARMTCVAFDQVSAWRHRHHGPPMYVLTDIPCLSLFLLFDYTVRLGISWPQVRTLD